MKNNLEKKLLVIASIAIMLVGFIATAEDNPCDGSCAEAALWDTLGYYQRDSILSENPPCHLIVNYQARYNPCTGYCEALISTVAIVPAGCSELTPAQMMDLAGEVIYENWPPQEIYGQSHYDIQVNDSCPNPPIGQSGQYTLFFAQCVRWADSTVLWNSGPEIPPNAAYLIPCSDAVGCCEQLYYVENIDGVLIAHPQTPRPIGAPLCETQYQPCFYICNEP